MLAHNSISNTVTQQHFMIGNINKICTDQFQVLQISMLFRCLDIETCCVSSFVEIHNQSAPSLCLMINQIR